jgi:hypothetical protein
MEKTTQLSSTDKFFMAILLNDLKNFKTKQPKTHALTKVS